ncbi:MAG: FTR1 family protein [Candidatus Micrarchaeota archaeon]
MALAEFTVLFREVLESAFVIGIMLTYLTKTKNSKYNKFVWGGALVGIFLSVLVAYTFQFSIESFEQYEEIFEGTFMIVTSLLVTGMILWIIKQKHIVESIKGDIKIKLDNGQPIGLFVLSAISVLREGVEVILFLAGIFLTTGTLSLIGGVLGAIAALITCILIFNYAVKFNIGLFFKATAAVLVLLAAGLFSQGLHELQEAKILPEWIEHVYDLNLQQNADGTYPIFHEKGIFGGTLKGLIGYDTNPSDLQVIGYLAYLGCAYWVYTRKLD